MTCLACQQDSATNARVEELAERIRLRAQELSDEPNIYETGLFRGAIERLRGQFSSDMAEKKYFARLVLSRLQDDGLISDFEVASSHNRFDYSVSLRSGKTAIIELKGCLDGNNTNIFERPDQANEFYIWSVCQNAAADPRKNAWSGIHSRLSAEIVQHNKRVDGVIIWDMVCGSVGRPCPKLVADPSRKTELGPYALPPPCLFVFPSTVPSARNNPNPAPHPLGDLEFLAAVRQGFRVLDDEVAKVFISVENRGPNLCRRTRIERAGRVVQQSRWNAIRRR